MRKSLQDIVTLSYVKSEVASHLVALSSGYLASLAMEQYHHKDEMSALISFGVKSGTFIAVKLWRHENERREMLKSNTIGTLVSTPQLLLHWGSLKLDILNEFTRYPISYGIGALGTIVRYAMDYRSGAMQAQRTYEE